VLEAHHYIPLKALKITDGTFSLVPGGTAQLHVKIVPANSTRNSVIWESSDLSIVSVDKFGIVTARKRGEAKISVYSWDDAHPVADNSPVTFSKKGISDSISVFVR
jgi:uncharacterized protein YjdB